MKRIATLHMVTIATTCKIVHSTGSYFCYGAFTQLRRHIVKVLQNNNVDVILDMSYVDDDTRDFLTQHIKVRTYTGVSFL